MADTTTPIPSVTEPMVDRHRKLTPAWLPFFRQLFQNIRAQAASIFSIQTTVDEINGRWGVSISENNRVTGAVLLDGSQTLSTFAVLADKFIVVHPSVDATTIQAFVVGNVNGTPTVGINGNLIVDGTILARHLDVASLSAITANVGTVTAGVLRSSDSNFVIDLNNKTLTIST